MTTKRKIINIYSLYFWFCILLSTVLILGWIGFRQACFGIWDSIYETMKLFVLNFDQAPPNNGLINVARFLAPITLLLGGMPAVMFIANEGLEKFKYLLMKTHTIVCGMGLTGSTIYNYSEDRKFILIDLNDLPLKKQARFNTIFINGDASSDYIIGKMKLNQAKQIYILTGEDYVNLKILHKIVFKTNKKQLPATIYIRIEDYNIKEALCKSENRTECDNSFILNEQKVVIFNASSCAIQKIEDKYKIFSENKKIAIFGCGSVGQDIIRAIHKNNIDVTQKVAVFEQSQAAIKSFKSIYAIDKDLIKFNCCNVTRLNTAEIKKCMDHIVPDIIFVCLGGDWAGIKMSVVLRKIYAKTTTEIVIISSEVTTSKSDEDKLFLLKDHDIEILYLQQNAVDMTLNMGKNG